MHLNITPFYCILLNHIWCLTELICNRFCQILYKFCQVLTIQYGWALARLTNFIQKKHVCGSRTEKLSIQRSLLYSWVMFCTLLCKSIRILLNSYIIQVCPFYPWQGINFSKPKKLKWLSHSRETVLFLSYVHKNTSQNFPYVHFFSISFWSYTWRIPVWLHNKEFSAICTPHQTLFVSWGGW